MKTRNLSKQKTTSHADMVAMDGAGETGNEELLFKGWRALVLQDKNSSGVGWWLW